MTLTLEWSIKTGMNLLLRFFVILLPLTTQASSLFGTFEPVPDSSVLVSFSQIQQDKKMPTILNMMSWNLHKGEAGSSFYTDLQFLARSKDLILTQEAMNDSVMPSEMLRLNFGDIWMAQSFRDVEANTTSGVATISRAKAFEVFFRRSPGVEPVVFTPKMTLATIYRLENNIPLLVLNIHGINFTNNTEFELQIKDLIPYIGNFPGKVIFAGDFNTWNVGRHLYLDNAMKKLKMTQIEFSNGQPENEYGLVLDHIFVRGCKVLEAKVVSYIDTSDHLPITAKLDCR